MLRALTKRHENSHNICNWDIPVAGSFLSPAVAGDSVFICAELGADGQEVWRSESLNLARCAPMVADGIIYVQIGNWGLSPKSVTLPKLNEGEYDRTMAEGADCAQ
ncbi:MAG: hypothetical protein U0350_13055 [Caldilineaceae bacterium]